MLTLMLCWFIDIVTQMEVGRPFGTISHKSDQQQSPTKNTARRAYKGEGKGKGASLLPLKFSFQANATFLNHSRGANMFWTIRV